MTGWEKTGQAGTAQHDKLDHLSPTSQTTTKWWKTAAGANVIVQNVHYELTQTYDRSPFQHNRKYYRQEKEQTFSKKCRCADILEETLEINAICLRSLYSI